MVAAAAIHGPAGRVTGEAAFERGGLDPIVELEAGIERFAAGAIGDQLDGLEQAPASDIADMPVITEALDQVTFMILVMTPNGMQSDSVRKEWRLARQKEVLGMELPS